MKLLMWTFMALGGFSLFWRFATRENARALAKIGFKHLLAYPWFHALILAHRDEINAVLEGAVAGVEDAENDATK